MKIDKNNYAVEPRVFLCGKESTVTVRPIGKEAAFETGVRYRVELIPEEITASSWMIKEAAKDTLLLTPEEGSLRFRYTFCGEQEWTISVRRDEEGADVCLATSVYSLEEDLYVRTPYRGDCHSHSCCSDGRDTPALVAANYRRAGYDFMALTDHSRWAPSDNMIRQYEGVPIDIRLFHGEEVHFRKSRIHIVNFGGARSVNEMIIGNEDAYEEQFRREGEALKETLPVEVDATEYAARKWIYEQIHACGGLAIFAHPCWMMNTRQYNVPHNMSEAVLRTGIYDAMELVTGQSVQENNVQQALYHEMRAQGLKIPVVGDSDSHGTENFKRYFAWAQTIVFAKDCEFESLCEGIRSLYSAAIEREATTGELRVHGPLRLVRYGNFLLQYYFPHHNDLCLEEGLQMQNYILGEPGAKEALARLHGRTAAYAARFFGR